MPNNTPTSLVFLKKPTNNKGILVQRTSYKCSSISCCEYSVLAIESSHTSWTIKDWEEKRANTRLVEQTFMDKWGLWVGQEETLM